MKRTFPKYAAAVFLVIVILCLFAELTMTADPTFMDASAISQPPSGTHFFGTDTLGRDIFSVIWYGGRISLLIGCLATLISTVIAMVYGCAAALSGPKLDDALMRFSEILMSVPHILLVIFLQAMLGQANVLSIGVVIGVTGWMAVAKMVRSEVKQIRNADYVLAAKSMGGGFFYILRHHLVPNFWPAIMFMVVTNLGTAIALEATLSFLGIGLPVNVLSWGSLLSLSQRAMLSGAWWLLLIPGLFLAVTLICITEIGEYLRTRNRRETLL